MSASCKLCWTGLVVPNNRWGVQANEHVIAKSPSLADGFNVVARAGTDVQEIHVVTSMSRNEMKQAIQTALNKLP